jgi:hypothetical protein
LDQWPVALVFVEMPGARVTPLQQRGAVTIRGTLERAADGSLDLFLTVRDTGSGYQRPSSGEGGPWESASETSSDDSGVRMLPTSMSKVALPGHQSDRRKLMISCCSGPVSLLKPSMILFTSLSRLL